MLKCDGRFRVGSGSSAAAAMEPAFGPVADNGTVERPSGYLVGILPLTAVRASRVSNDTASANNDRAYAGISTPYTGNGTLQVRALDSPYPLSRYARRRRLAHTTSPAEAGLH